jgi:hypothetical protein
MHLKGGMFGITGDMFRNFQSMLVIGMEYNPAVPYEVYSKR